MLLRALCLLWAPDNESVRLAPFHLAQAANSSGLSKLRIELSTWWERPSKSDTALHLRRAMIPLSGINEPCGCGG